MIQIQVGLAEKGLYLAAPSTNNIGRPIIFLTHPGKAGDDARAPPPPLDPYDSSPTTRTYPYTASTHTEPLRIWYPVRAPASLVDELPDFSIRLVQCAMMVSEQKHALQTSAARSNHAANALATTTSTDAAAGKSNTGLVLVDAVSQSMDMSFAATAHAMAASADPVAAAAAAAAVGLADPNAESALGEAMAFAALPFDENLMNLPHGHSNGAASSFFIDTAMLAQQIAAVVADEKKLSDVSDPVPEYWTLLCACGVTILIRMGLGTCRVHVQ